MNVHLMEQSGESEETNPRKTLLSSGKVGPCHDQRCKGMQQLSFQCTEHFLAIVYPCRHCKNVCSILQNAPATAAQTGLHPACNHFFRREFKISKQCSCPDLPGQCTVMQGQLLTGPQHGFGDCRRWQLPAQKQSWHTSGLQWTLTGPPAHLQIVLVVSLSTHSGRLTTIKPFVRELLCVAAE